MKGCSMDNFERIFIQNLIAKTYDTMVGRRSHRKDTWKYIRETYNVSRGIGMFKLSIGCDTGEMKARER